jgi:chorismate mutase
MQANYMLVKDPLSLDRIRSILTRLEDTIIFSLIERAQFAHNPRIYRRGVFKELLALQFEGSWLEWFLKETETFHGVLARSQTHSRTYLGFVAKARRFTRPVAILLSEAHLI